MNLFRVFSGCTQQQFRCLCTSLWRGKSPSLEVQLPELDYDYLCNPANVEEIRLNIMKRKGVGNIDGVIELQKKWETAKEDEEKQRCWAELCQEAVRIPNRSHPDTPSGEPFIVEIVGHGKQCSSLLQEFEKLVKPLDGLRTSELGLVTGHKSYYFKNDITRLEQALISYCMQELTNLSFVPVSVPDLLHPRIIEGCGMQTKGERSQVYALECSRHGEVCLSGTAEMPLAALYKGITLESTELPLRLASVSRCYRAETSSVQEERGIYRVHQFTKVEMFGITSGEAVHDSEQLLQEFLSIQKHIFTTLGLHFKILNMPAHELGAPAYQKFDIEAWMPGRQIFGEVSSASNCTDFQSRRLHIKCKMQNGAELFCHTVNGTACAIPRMIIALLETFQEQDGTIKVPEVLQRYLGGQQFFRPIQVPKLHWIKHILQKA